MIIKQSFATTKAIDLAEFCSVVESAGDLQNEDVVWSLGEALTMLGNNRSFLSECLLDYIKNNNVISPFKDLASQTIILEHRQLFYVRAAFWLPANYMSISESNAFAFDLPHDHNFNLLSYNYCGSGYATDVFEYDYDAVAGYVGEQVDVDFTGNTTLSQGEVILYRKSKDIHNQHAPSTPTITINLMPIDKERWLRDQYVFRIEDKHSGKAEIVGYPFTPTEARHQILELLKHRSVADAKVVDLLAEFSVRHECRRTRMHALEALADLDETMHLSLCLKLRDDSSKLVRGYARTVLDLG